MLLVRSETLGLFGSAPGSRSGSDAWSLAAGDSADEPVLVGGSRVLVRTETT